MIVRVTMQLDVDIEVTEQEAAGLRDLGILVEPAPEPAGPLLSQAVSPPLSPQRPRRRGSAPVRGADS